MYDAMATMKKNNKLPFEPDGQCGERGAVSIGGGERDSRETQRVVPRFTDFFHDSNMGVWPPAVTQIKCHGGETHVWKTSQTAKLVINQMNREEPFTNV